MIIRSRIVVPMEGEPIEDGAVVVEGNRIASVARFDDVGRHHSGHLVDLGEHILLPGLINAHCHLDYTMLRGKIAPHGSFTEWIRTINAEKATLTEQDYIDAINVGFAEARRFGTTTIANLTAFPHLAATVTEPVRTWWFGELIDVRNPNPGLADKAVALLKPVKHWGLAPHAPFTASKQLYARCNEIVRGEGFLLTTHLAESADEMQMFRDRTGSLFDFLRSIGRPMNDCGSGTPLSFLLQTEAIGQRWIIAHLNELDRHDFILLGDAPKFHVVHCPRSHTFFGHAAFALDRLQALGFNICLGTDSLASNSDLSLFAEMRELLRNESGLSPREVLAMATLNGALALGQRGLLGTIQPGAFADLVALPNVPSDADVFEKIVAFEETVPWMMLNGDIVTAG